MAIEKVTISCKRRESLQISRNRGRSVGKVRTFACGAECPVESTIRSHKAPFRQMAASRPRFSEGAVVLEARVAGIRLGAVRISQLGVFVAHLRCHQEIV